MTAAMCRHGACPGIFTAMSWRLLPTVAGLLLLVLGMNVCHAEDVAAGAGIASGERWDRLADPVFRHVVQDVELSEMLLPVVLAEDATGALWVGGQNGLSRWDGYRAHDYSSDQAGTDGLLDHDVLAIHRDGAGRLWVGTSAGGLARFDLGHDRFVPVPLSAEPDAQRVASLADDGIGGLWVATNAGLLHLDAAGGVVSHLRHHAGQPGSLPDDKVLSVLLDHSGALWAGTVNGLARAEDGRGHFIMVPLPVAAGVVPEVTRLFEDSLHRVWIGTRQHGAFVVGPDHAPARFIAMTGRIGRQDTAIEIFAIAEIAPGRIWLGTFGHGIVQVAGSTLDTSRIVRDPLLPDSLDTNTILSLHLDRSGIVWIGTNLGLSQYIPNNGGITTVFGRLGRMSGLRDSDFYSVMVQADGRVWAGGATGGIDILDAAGGSAGGMEAQRIFSLARAPAGGTLVGTRSGLFLADAAGREIAKLEVPTRRAMSAAFALCTLDEAVWLGGGDDGLWQLHLAPDGRVTVLRHETAPRLTNSTVFTIQPGPVGTLMVGTENGFNLLDRASGAIERIFPDPVSPTGLSAGHIVSSLLDRNGRLWLGTNNAGINVMLGRNSAGRPVFRHLSVAQGLPNSDANQLLLDHAGRVWVSTDNGLAVIDPKTFAVRAFRGADGLAITQYWSHSGDVTAQGEIVFGGVGGLTIIRPDRMVDWRYEPRVVVTEVRAGGRLVPGDLTAPGRVVTVPPGADSLSVEFSALDYSAPLLNRYRYRLEGYDDAWVEADAGHRVASYTNLRPGSYRLRLSGSNRNGHWTRQEVALQISVLPAWYQTIWCRIAEAILALLWVVGIVQGRTVMLRRRQHDLERQVDGRTAELLARTEALTESRQLLHRYAYFDTLSTLPNRRAFNEACQTMIEEAARTSAGFAMVLIDLDGFKWVNDTMGHDGGDRLLVIAAERMAAVLRAGDFVARLGGDEFALLLGDVRNRSAVHAICDRIVVGMAQPMMIGETRVVIGASAGAAMFPEHGLTQDDLFKHADVALYKSKAAGKGVWSWFSNDMMEPSEPVGVMPEITVAIHGDA